METSGSSPAFHQHFKQRVSDVQSQIESLSRPDLSAESRKAMTETILASLTKLSATLGDASSDLASYDQRSYNQTVKALQDQLVMFQATNAPKTKFSFKNKKSTTGNNPASLIKSGQRSHMFAEPPGPASDIDSTATSGSATPLHLQDPEDGNMPTSSPVPPFAPPPLYPSVADPFQNMPENTAAELRASTYSNDQGLTMLVRERTNSYFSLEGYRQRIEPETGPADAAADREQRGSQPCIVTQIWRSIINFMPPVGDTVYRLSSLTLTTSYSMLLVAPAVNGPAHITDIRNSVLVLSCRQFRMHDSHNVTVYLHCTSRPIIENCTGIHFATLPVYFRHASWSQTTNMFDQVDDFKWLRAEASPNWDLLSEDKQVSDDTWINLLENIKKHDIDPDFKYAQGATTIGSVLRTFGIKGYI